MRGLSRSRLPFVIVALATVALGWKLALEALAPGATESAGVVPGELVRGPAEPDRDGAQRRAAGHLARPAAEDAVQIVGTVSHAASGLPLVRHVVTLAWHPTDDPPTKATALTGSNGEFALRLPGGYWSPGHFYWASVTSPEGERVFRGTVPLQNPLEILVLDKPLVRGRLETDPPLDYGGVRVRVWAPEVQAISTQLLCGTAMLDEEGRFEVGIDEPVACTRLQLVFSDATGCFARAELLRAVLTTGEGALVTKSLGQVRLTVETSDGTPLADAAVRVYPRGEGAAVAWNLLETDAQGVVRLLLESGSYETCVGRAGFAPGVLALEVRPEESEPSWRVGMQPLAQGDELAGAVLACDGEPVAGARVTALPLGCGEHTGLAGAVEGTTDGAGEFRVPWPAAQGALLGAEHPDHGRTRLQHEPPAASAPLLRFPPQGVVLVRPEAPSAIPPPAPGPMQFFLVDRDGEGWRSGYSNGCPWAIVDVPAGRYDLFVTSADAALYAQADVVVSARARVPVEVRLSESSTLFGHVVDSTGATRADLTVVVEHPTWPEPVARAWGRAQSAADGSFRVPAGDLATANVRVLDGELVLTRARLAGGQATDVHLP